MIFAYRYLWGRSSAWSWKNSAWSESSTWSEPDHAEFYAYAAHIQTIYLFRI